MGALRKIPGPALVGLLLACAGLLSACDEGDEAPVPAAPPPAAQSLLGTDLLAPDDAMAIAAGLTAADLPPDAAAALADEDLAPAA